MAFFAPRLHTRQPNPKPSLKVKIERGNALLSAKDKKHTNTINTCGLPEKHTKYLEKYTKKRGNGEKQAQSSLPWLGSCAERCENDVLSEAC